MININTILKIVIICVICTVTMTLVSASEFTSAQYNSAAGEGEYIHNLFYGITHEYTKQNIVLVDFIGPLVISQNYENTIRAVSMTTFYGDVITVNVSNYYRI